MKSAFRKISSVGSLTGGTKWYLSSDCLLAANRTMYAVEYRRFYLRDLESIVVWPSRLWLFRMIIPALLFGILSASLWAWANATVGAIFAGVGLAWVVLELLLGPTALSRIRTTGATVDLPLVRRTWRARKVLGKIDEAIRAARGINEQAIPAVTSPQPESTVQSSSEAASVTPSIADATQTNGS